MPKKIPTAAYVDVEKDCLLTWEEIKKGMSKVELAHHEESIARLKKIVAETQKAKRKN
jgi:hypothetical protein